jgi:hypothetical protein
MISVHYTYPLGGRSANDAVASRDRVPGDTAAKIAAIGTV